jgi:hypothetical protein
MAVLVRLDAFTEDELRRLVFGPAASDEACRLRGLACVEWFRRGGWSRRREGRGRWPLLVWFTQRERIMSVDELAESLARYRSEHPPC